MKGAPAFVVALVGSAASGLLLTPLDLRIVGALILVGLAAGVLGRGTRSAAATAVGSALGLGGLVVLDLAGLSRSVWNASPESFNDQETPGLMPLVLAIAVGLELAVLIGYGAAMLGKRVAARAP